MTKSIQAFAISILIAITTLPALAIKGPCNNLTNSPYLTAVSAEIPPPKLEKDINRDGKFTISDVGNIIILAINWLGNYIIYATISLFPKVAQFFELSCIHYNSVTSFLLSIVGFFSILFTWGYLLVLKDDFDEWRKKIMSNTKSDEQKDNDDENDPK